MKKFFVRLFVALVSVAAVFYLFVLWYLNGAGFRRMVERAASESLNAEVVIASLGVATPLRLMSSDIRVV